MAVNIMAVYACDLGRIDPPDAGGGVPAVRALQRTCEAVAVAHAGIEMYYDDEEAPLLYDFITDGADPFPLPHAPSGAPWVTWHDPAHSAAYLAGFRQARDEESIEPTYLRPEELDNLLEVLTAAQAHGVGVFIVVED
jgi:hypothetical protein